MQKIGSVVIRENNIDVQYSFVWITVGATYERIDVIKDLSKYNYIDTSNCEASYIYRNKDRYYGDKQIIQQILKAKMLASTFKLETKQDFSINENGEAVIVQEKYDIGLGLRMKLTLVNGWSVEELYETPEATITIFQVEQGDKNIIDPINFSDYESKSILKGVSSLTSDTAEYYELAELKRMYPGELDHIESYDFVVADDIQIAEKRLKEWIESPNKIKAIDTETTGTDVGYLGVDCIVGFVLSYSENDSTYYPFRQEKVKNLPISFLQKIIDAINDQPKDTIIIPHNGKFDKQVIWKESAHTICYADEFVSKFDEKYREHALTRCDMRIDEDTYLLSLCVNPKVKGKEKTHGLKYLVSKCTGLTWLELDDIFVDKKKIKFNVLPKELIKYYACPDTANTIKVYKWLLPQLPEDEWRLYKDVECNLIDVKACNEFFGMRRNSDVLYKSIEHQEAIVQVLGDQFRYFHKTSKNINSSNVLQEIFYNRLRCPVLVYTKKGAPAVSKEAIRQIIDDGKVRKDIDPEEASKADIVINGETVVKGSDLLTNRYPSLIILQRYNKSKKELSALKRIQNKSKKDRVFFYVNQMGAESNRQTSDAQQYSDGMKKLIISDSTKHNLISCDYKQIELRVLAFLADEKELIKMESDPDIDIHRAILSIINGIPMWAISASMRKKGKSTNFGVVYGMTEYGLARSRFGPKYTRDELVQCMQDITDFYNGLPGIKKYNNKNAEDLKTNGYITTRFGWYRYFDDIKKPDITEKEVAKMIKEGCNTPVQGFAATLLKQTEINIYEYIKMKGWDELIECDDGLLLPRVRLMLPIHDEVLVSSDKTIPIEEILLMFKECMEIKIKGAPPFFAAPAFVGNWFDGKDDAFEIPISFRDEILEKYSQGITGLVTYETYLKDLNDYRTGRLKSYMDGLVSEYKTVNAVAEHVRHDDLTHVLISAFIDEKKHPEDKELSHEQCILVATRRYMESKGEDISKLMESTPNVTREDYQDRVNCVGEDIDKFIYFDQNGEAIIDEDEDDESDGEYYAKNSNEYKDSDVEKQYSIFMLDTVIVDASEFEDGPEVVRIYKELAKLSGGGKPYRVIVYTKNKTLETSLMVDYIPKEIEDIVKKYEALYV